MKEGKQENEESVIGEDDNGEAVEKAERGKGRGRGGEA